MRKILIVTSVAFFAACNNSGDTAKVDSMSSAKDSATASAGQTINSPYAVNYSSKFEMGDAKNAEAVLALWKDWDGGTLMNSKDRFADTLELHFSNGAMIRTSRDSAVAMAQKERDNFASSVSSVDAITALKSTDKDQNWAVIWGKEVDTDKKGKVDSFYLQETWRFNKDGKADLLYQFRAAAAPKK